MILCGVCGIGISSGYNISYVVEMMVCKHCYYHFARFTKNDRQRIFEEMVKIRVNAKLKNERIAKLNKLNNL